jgi:predicted TIM-barrel fold metal-dependent hydrolase
MTEKTVLPHPVYDCDSHYYEAVDAFTRHVDPRMQSRCVQWAEIQGRQRHLVGGEVDYSVANPTFDPIARPGVLWEYYRGNPTGRPASEIMRGNLEPIPAAYREPEARLHAMDDQGIQASLLFPTLGVLYEEKLKHDTDAVCALFQGFNRWLEEDWGLNHQERIFSAPYISLADVDWACRELEWALENDARVIVMRPAAIFTKAGPRSPADPIFDPFWSRVDEAGLSVVIHTGNSGYTSQGYADDQFARSSIGMSRRPSIKGLAVERAAADFLLTLAYELLFERFPRLRILSIENGSGFLPDLLRKLEYARERNPWHFKEDPVSLFREHVWVSPFWEDNIPEVVSWIGADRVIFGSDWPHMEGLPEPLGILEEISPLSDEERKAILFENTRALTQRL